MSSGKFQLRNTGSAKLTITQVQEIRLLYGQGTWTQGKLSQHFGVSVVQIGRIVRGETWQHIPHIATNRELQESAERLMAVQRERDGLASAEMQAAIAAERDRQGRGDRMLGEAAASDPAVPPSPLDE